MSLLAFTVSYIIMFEKVRVRQERYNTNSLTVLINAVVEIRDRRGVSEKKKDE